MDAAGFPVGAWGSGGSMNVTAGSGGAAGSSGTTTQPPEIEVKVQFLAPRAGARYVYVANPSRNTVSIIDSVDLGIVERAPGDSPTYMATIPGRDVALVINVGSHTLRVLSADQLAGDPIPIVSKANAIAIAPDGRHAVVWYDAAQSGVTTTQASTSTTGSTQEVSVITLTPATAASAATGSAISMSVGYNPSAVVFSSDGAAAFVVTDDGISELRFANLTAPGIAPFTRIDKSTTSLARPDAGIALLPDAQPVLPDAAPGAESAPDAPPATGPGDELDAGAVQDGGGSPWDGGAPLDGGASPDGQSAGPDLATPDRDLPPPADATAPPPGSIVVTGKPVDVSVTPDGAYAVARREGSAQLLLVDLRTHAVTPLNLPSQITDLDILPSGAAAFAVLRGQSSRLVRIDIPAGFGDAAHRTDWTFANEDLGSVTMSGRGRYGLLYTTAEPTKSVVVFDPVNESYLTVDLHKPIRAVAVAPDENTALVLHTPPTTSGSGSSSGAGGTSGAGSSSSAVDKAYGYTLVRLEDGFSKLQLTAADPNPFAITPSSSHAFVLLRDDKAGVRLAERIDLASYIADDFPLGSPPNSIAALAEVNKVFVGQVYSEGRISFIDWRSGEVQTVTGFALNGRIQQ